MIRTIINPLKQLALSLRGIEPSFLGNIQGQGVFCLGISFLMNSGPLKLSLKN